MGAIFFFIFLAVLFFAAVFFIIMSVILLIIQYVRKRRSETVKKRWFVIPVVILVINILVAMIPVGYIFFYTTQTLVTLLKLSTLNRGKRLIGRWASTNQPLLGLRWTVRNTSSFGRGSRMKHFS